MPPRKHCRRARAAKMQSRPFERLSGGGGGGVVLLVAGLILWIAELALSKAQLSSGCERVHFGRLEEQNIACKCDALTCDTELDFHWPQDDAHLVELVSSRAGARFELRTVPLAALTGRGATQSLLTRTVEVDASKRLQRVVGYGGALTDSASMLIASRLDAATRAQLMQAYFGPTGLDYNLARVPIGGTDMSWRAYSYDDLRPTQGAQQQEDWELAHFRLQEEDLEFKLPLIRQANSIRVGPKCERERQLRLLASSWSAPNWMKSNEHLVQGRLKESFDGKYYDAYARYLVRFMAEYERELGAGGAGGAEHAKCQLAGLKIWALTPQNEPCTPGRLGHSVVNYNSVNFAPKEMGQFVRFNLIPNLLRANRTARELALFMWDDTLLGLDQYKRHLFGGLLDEEAGAGLEHAQAEKASLERKKLTSGYASFDRRTINDYVRGLALHWYSQGLDKLPYKSLYDLRRWLPARYSMLSTEASFIGRPKPGEWARGEKYARDIIENLRAGSVGWIDWNLALNLEGGPTWSKNFLDAAVLIDDQPNNNSSRFYKNPMFYAIGHLSRFIKANSHVISSQVLVPDSALSLGQNSSSAGAGQAEPDSPRSQMSNETTSESSHCWRPVDEMGEQTSELLVVAGELDELPASGWRPLALVLLNRANERLAVRLKLANCQSRLGRQQLELNLEAKSITSYAFNC